MIFAKITLPPTAPIVNQKALYPILEKFWMISSFTPTEIPNKKSNK